MRPAITIPTVTLEHLLAIARRTSGPPAQQASKLKHSLGRFTDFQRAELLALSRVGLSRNGESEWTHALQQAQALNDTQRIASLLATDDLADAIEDGLIEIGCALMAEQEMEAA